MSKCHKDDDVCDDEANAASSIHGKLERGVTNVSRQEILPSKDHAVSE